MKDENFLRAENARHLWHPMAHPGRNRLSPPTIFVGAEGIHLTDIDGNRVIDAVAGLWCVNLGYSNPVVKHAIGRQLELMPYCSAFGASGSDAAIEASAALTDFLAPDGMARVFFTSGGSDAVETALRLARQYHKLRGEAGRVKFLSLGKGYHGTHFGAASVNGNARFRRPYEPLLPECHHLPAPYLYRNPWGAENAAALADLIVAAAEEQIALHGPATIAALIMEPILGAGGVLVPHPALMGRLRDLCARHGILFIADEVITGFGRTGAWTGARLWGVQPDMMTCAKGITSAYFPVGACLVSEAVAEVFEADRTEAGTIFHGYTYSAHPVGAAAVVATLAETARLDLAANAAARGAQLHRGLERLARRHEVIGEVRGGHGLVAAVELVADRQSRAPLAAEAVARIHGAIYACGVQVRPLGNVLALSPPLVVTADEIDEILDAVDRGLAAFGGG